MKKKVAICFDVLVLFSLVLVSCHRDYRCTIDVDAEYFGEELVFNDTKSAIEVSVDGSYADETESLVLDIQPGTYGTIRYPGVKWHVCIKNCTAVTITSSGGRTVLDRESSDWFNHYVFTEEDYYLTLHGERCLASAKWPTYTYHITDEVLTQSHS